MENIGSLLRNNILNLVYIFCCLLLSLPFFISVLTVINSHYLPTGFDNTVHAFFIERMLETGNPLIDYSAFPDLVHQHVDRYYPSLMHMIISGATYIFGLTSPIQVVAALKTFIVLVSIGGSIGFALLVREILKVSLYKSYRINLNEFELKVRVYFMLLCFLVFGILIFSTSLLVKTINDGSYPEVFAMWFIFPFYMVFLIRNRWIISGILLAVIAATHNLSLIMTFAVTVAYLSSFLINGKWYLLKRSAILFITFGALSIPSLLLFYIPTIQGVVSSTAGNTEVFSQEIFRTLLSPFIYYSAMLVSVILLVLNYKRLSWFSIWIVLNFVVMSYFPLVGPRMARESLAVFGMIIGVCLVYFINLILTSEFLLKFVKKKNILAWA